MIYNVQQPENISFQIGASIKIEEISGGEINYFILRHVNDETNVSEQGIEF